MGRNPTTLDLITLEYPHFKPSWTTNNHLWFNNYNLLLIDNGNTLTLHHTKNIGIGGTTAYCTDTLINTYDLNDPHSLTQLEKDIQTLAKTRPQ